MNTPKCTGFGITEVRQAMAVIEAVLREAKPEVPEGCPPLTVPGWCELRDAWSGYYLLQRYFGIVDPLPPADDAPDDIDIYNPSRVNKWVSLPGDVTADLPQALIAECHTRQGHRLNTKRITEARWRRLDPVLRAKLRRRLGRKAAIVNHQVLTVAQALCNRGAYSLAFDLYHGLSGQPMIPCEGCGLGLLMNLRELMGEDPASIGESLLIQR